MSFYAHPWNAGCLYSYYKSYQTFSSLANSISGALTTLPSNSILPAENKIALTLLNSSINLFLDILCFINKSSQFDKHISSLIAYSISEFIGSTWMLFCCLNPKP